MHTTMKTIKYLRSALNFALGAGAVVGGSYIFSRIKEKQDAETRIERMEQILEKLSEEKD
ncbi:MAG: hypothetical protein KGZ93_07335 [Actinobacteria bacterium]|nr:hypothetical protein [Actinomycetota bacterium]